MSAFPENSSSALQSYCRQEGVKVRQRLPQTQTIFLLRLHTVTLMSGFVLQDVLIPELMKKLDILGDNGVSLNILLDWNKRYIYIFIFLVTGFPKFSTLKTSVVFSVESQKWGTGRSDPSRDSNLTVWKGEWRPLGHVSLLTPSGHTLSQHLIYSKNSHCVPVDCQIKYAW